MFSISKSEQSYIATSLSSEKPLRADGRDLLEYRPIHVECGVAPLANGSGRAIVGVGDDTTEVLVAGKLEVEDTEEELQESGEATNGRLTCYVSCTSAAYPYHTNNQLEDLSSDLSSTLFQLLSSSAFLLPDTASNNSQLSIIPQRKHWHLTLEAVIICDSGNVVDALFIAARAALWDLRIPKTRSLEYRGPQTQTMDIDQGPGHDAFKTVADKKESTHVIDFELEDNWDDGVPLEDREALPVCVTLNLLPSKHFLDASLQEERSAPLKLHLAFSFTSSALSSSKAQEMTGPMTRPPPPPDSIRNPPNAVLQGMRLSGSGDLPIGYIRSLLKDGESYARSLAYALNSKLREDDRKRASEL
ncbi:hypothetical protein FRC03_012414 [Tulasnella sp. 419]|nr:hypothetical protein FRC03_012414 [Tulasnella sp. 419]